MKKVIVYFTDSRLEEELDEAVRKQILKAGIDVISVSQKPEKFGKNICVGWKQRSYISLYEQLLIGLKSAPKDSIIYLCEHDVFYHPTYFEFIPEDKDKIYFNLNRYFWRRGLDTFLPAIGKRALSQCVAYREALIVHASGRLKRWKKNRSSYMTGPFENWRSKFANVDIRHYGNFSAENEQKGSYLKGCLSALPMLSGWGTTQDFQDNVGYRSLKTGTMDLLHKRFNPASIESPVIIPNFYRDDLATLFCELGMSKGAEIGVKRGDYSSILCMSNPLLKLKCIDAWNPTVDTSWDLAETIFIHAKKKLNPFNAKIIRKTSVYAADETPQASLGFVYIDADHSFNNVMQDIILWADRVRQGGIVSGHDYDNPDVKTAVDAYVKIYKFELFVTEKGKKYPDSSPTWFFAKGDL